ncbi:MAG: hypothetical protein AAGG01_01970 [Planctomycetota bacterium]
MSTDHVTPPTAANGLLRISAILWVIWGVVHVAAGVITLKLLGEERTAEAIHGIASKVALETLQMSYPAAVSALLSQHALNLAWFGAVTLVCSPFIWRGSRSAVYLAALVGGLADFAYFLFIDLGGFATPPGPQMTYICATAIVAGLIGLRRSGEAAS